MKKTSLLIVIGNLNVGGAERHLLKVMPKLQERHFDIRIYTTNQPGTLAPEMMAAGVPVIAPTYRAGFNRWCKPLVYAISMIKLYRLLRQQKPDILHFYLPGAYLLGGLTAWLARHPCLIMSRRIIYGKKYQKSLFFRLEKWLHKRLRFALACSSAIYTQLRAEGIETERLATIYNGVEIELYLNLPDKSFARQTLGLPTQAFIMTIIANLYPYKAHIDLLEALALIKNQLPKDWILLIVGRDGGERPQLEAKTRALSLEKHVLFLGQRMDTPTLLAAADMGISCSHEEGFSNAVLESMAAGLPMVVTDISGNNEAIVDGENGLIVPKASPETLAKALLKLAHNHTMRSLMSTKTKQFVQARFSLEKTIADYANFYGQIKLSPP